MPPRPISEYTGDIHRRIGTDIVASAIAAHRPELGATAKAAINMEAQITKIQAEGVPAG